MFGAGEFFCSHAGEWMDSPAIAIKGAQNFYILLRLNLSRWKQIAKLLFTPGNWRGRLEIYTHCQIVQYNISPICTGLSVLQVKMASVQLRLQSKINTTILFLIFQEVKGAAASPILSPRGETTSSGGLSQPEKITLYVVAALGAFFAIIGVAISILRPGNADKVYKNSRRATQSILKTIPIVQYSHGNRTYPSTRASSLDSTDELDKEKIEMQRNTTCPICTEDFIENQMLRLLPCNHQYHRACIEDWLARGSSCPVWYVQTPS